MPALCDGRDRLVQSKVPLRVQQGVLADVQICDRLCATTRRVKRETTGEAEGIQDFPPSCIVFDPSPVLALIEEEPGLLPFHHVRFEAELILLEDHEV